MNNIAGQISQSLNLPMVLSEIDFLTIFLLIILAVFILLKFINLFRKKSSPKEPISAKEELVVEAKPEAKVEVVPTLSWEKRLFKGLSKTRSEVWGRIGSIVNGKKLDDDVVEELEEILFTSDLAPALVDELLEDLKAMTAKEDDSDYLGHIKQFMKSKMADSQEKVNTELYKFDKSFQGPKVIMIVGVNGAGKTTTIGKLATKLKSQGATVVVGACDTFRAAAVEQLEVWCKRADVEMVRAAEGADPTGVAFDAVAKAKEISADYCIIDTAGRLHTKSNLMDELAKTKKVMSKVLPDAPHETLLVLDAITGQNALRQAEEFNKVLELTGLIFTKCDGSAKAGSAVSIVQSLNVPIVYIGVGEDVEDLNIFNLDLFLNALLGIEA